MNNVRDKKGRFFGGLSELQKQEVMNRYRKEKISGTQLAREYGVSRSYITKLLNKNGIKIIKYTAFKRKYPFNEFFFEQIDTETKAYFLGLLYADGCNNTKKGSITIRLQERDKDILEKFKKNVNCKISLRFNNLNIKNKNWQNQLGLELYSKKMSKDLELLGCVSKKSLILKLPTESQVPSHLLHHFIRGYFDGDGHIIDNGGSSVVSSKDFINMLKKVFTKLKIKSKVYSCKNPKTKRLTIHKRLESLKMLDWIYEKATVYLDRKYRQYISINRILKINQFK